MPARVTRSSTKASMPPPPSPSASNTTKRSPPLAPSTPPQKKRKTATLESPYIPPTPRTEQAIADLIIKQEEQGSKQGTVLLHPQLKFDYSQAKRHLIASDERWRSIMDKLECKPFEGEQSRNEPFNPFKSLVSSILGQQVSWLAARSIQHKFCRLWAPHLPEKLPPPDSGIPRVEDPFPLPEQVLSIPDRRETLRSAGLSYRKVEYIVELAERFNDGRLDAKSLWEMDDDQVLKTLTEVRGIGVCEFKTRSLLFILSLLECVQSKDLNARFLLRGTRFSLGKSNIPRIWVDVADSRYSCSLTGTVHMFLIFSMKRADILPIGDLGTFSPLWVSLPLALFQSHSLC